MRDNFKVYAYMLYVRLKKCYYIKTMTLRKCIFLCIAAMLVFSCVKEKENTGYVDQIVNTVKINIDDLKESAKEKEFEAMKNFLYKNDRYFDERNAEIDFIERANFGIPGGENWIVKLNSMHIIIYVINGGRIEEDYYGTISGQYFVDQSMEEVSKHDILHDIPGTHIPGGSVSFGDFNGDGVDELFRYLYVKELGHNIDIFHYEPQIKGFAFCRIRYKNVDLNRGLAPVKFMKYRGKHGFKVYYSNIEASGGQRWVPEPDPKNDKWIFYAWDEKLRMFVDTGEVVD